MSATWARLRLGRVYHRALSLALSTAPTEGPPTPQGHLADPSPLTCSPHVRTPCMDLRSTERLIPAHGTHAESWAYRDGHLSEGALASTDAPHEESGHALLDGLPISRGKAGVTASGDKLQSKKATEDTQMRLTLGEKCLELDVKIKLLPTKTTAMDSKVSEVNIFPGIEPERTGIKLPAIKTTAGIQVQPLIPEDPASNVWSFVETNDYVAVPELPMQSSGQEINTGLETNAQLTDGRNTHLIEIENVVLAQFSSETTQGSRSSQPSSKDSGFQGTYSDLFSKKSTLEAAEITTQKFDDTDRNQKEPVVQPIADSSQSFASTANIYVSASALFTPICELLPKPESDSTSSTSSSTTPDLSSASTNSSDGLDRKADSHESLDLSTVIATLAGPCLESSFIPPPPPPPMPPF